MTFDNTCTLNVPEGNISPYFQVRYRYTFRNADGEDISHLCRPVTYEDFIRTSQFPPCKKKRTHPSRQRTHPSRLRRNLDRAAKALHKERLAGMTEELIAAAMHPRRLVRHLELGGEPEDF